MPRIRDDVKGARRPTGSTVDPLVRLDEETGAYER